MALTDKLSAIGEAIRAKTGKSDKLTLDQMPGEIAGITGGGGGGGANPDANDPVYYVTFMNGDQVLYVRPVVRGEDCTDVVAKNIIPAPTKESTVQYNYTHYGWGVSDGGAANANILKNITEDKTVYAIFSSTLQTYTITYLDDDGSVLKTETLTYGSTPAYTPVKTGAAFQSWTPAVETVTGDATYTATWIARHPEEEDGYALVLPTTDVAVKNNGDYYISDAIEAYEVLELGATYKITINGTAYAGAECKQYGVVLKKKYGSTTMNSNPKGVGNPWAYSMEDYTLNSVTHNGQSVANSGGNHFVTSWKSGETNYINLYHKYSNVTYIHSLKIQRVL